MAAAAAVTGRNENSRSDRIKYSFSRVQIWQPLEMSTYLYMCVYKLGIRFRDSRFRLWLLLHLRKEQVTTLSRGHFHPPFLRTELPHTIWTAHQLACNARNDSWTCQQWIMEYPGSHYVWKCSTPAGWLQVWACKPRYKRSQNMPWDGTG